MGKRLPRVSCGPANGYKRVGMMTGGIASPVMLRSMRVRPRPAARFCWERWPCYFTAYHRRELVHGARAERALRAFAASLHQSSAAGFAATPLPTAPVSVYVRDMGKRREGVELYFIDRDGVRWRVYEFGHGVNGERMIQYPVGTMRGTYRGFVTTGADGRMLRRAVMIIKKAEVEAARALSPEELQAELDRSEDWDRRGPPRRTRP